MSNVLIIIRIKHCADLQLSLRLLPWHRSAVCSWNAQPRLLCSSWTTRSPGTGLRRPAAARCARRRGSAPPSWLCAQLRRSSRPGCCCCISPSVCWSPPPVRVRRWCAGEPGPRPLMWSPGGGGGAGGRAAAERSSPGAPLPSLRDPRTNTGGGSRGRGRFSLTWVSSLLLLSAP